MLKITVVNSTRGIRIKLEGKLSGLWVEEMRRCWRSLTGNLGEQRAIVDLSDLDFVDSDGQFLFQEMHRDGARLHASTPIIRAVVQEVCKPRRRACKSP